MERAKSARLIEGPVGKTLVRLTIPMIFGVMGMVIFNLIDTFFLGQVGTNELAAISFTFPVVLVIASMSMGLGVGASSVISRAIGEGSHTRVRRLTTDSLVLAALLAGVVMLVGLLTIDPVFRLLGATSEVLALVRQYMLIWYMGALFVIIPMVGNNAIRATGDTKTASMIMLVAVAVNLILDPLLIFGIGPFPELGIAGAAIATVTARFSTLAVSLWVLALRERMLTFRPPQMQEVVDSWKEILFIGLPTAATNMINPLAIGIITSLVATYGAAAVAGFGAATRIDMFAMTVIMAMSSVLGPFVGQNWGAGLRDRVDLAIKYAQRFALLWGLAVFVLLLLVREPLARVFNDNPDVIATMALYLAIVPIGYGFKGTVLLSSSVLNVLRKPLHASALILAQLIVLYIPLAYLGSYLFGLTGIFVAAAFANILVGTVSYRWLRRFIDTIENQRAPLPQQPPDGIAEEGSLPEAGRA